MTEEEKQELELLRQEKHTRTQTARAEAALGQAGVSAAFAPLLIGSDDADTDSRTQRFCEAYRTALTEDVRQRLPQQPPVVTAPATQHRARRGIQRVR